MHTRDSEEERWQSHRRWLYLLAKVLLAGAALFAFWFIAAFVWRVLSPVLVSLLIAYLLDPLIDWFEARKISRTVAIAGVALVVLLIIGALGLFIVPTFVQQFSLTMQKLPEWFDGVWSQASHFAQDRFGYSSEELDANLKKAVASAQATLLLALSNVWSSASAILHGLLVPVFVFYFLRDFDTLKLRPLVLVPPRYKDLVVERARHVDLVVGKWVRGQTEVALVLAVLYAIGLTIAGVRLGPVIGVVAGLLCVVPYFGAGIGIILSVLMVLVEHGGVRELLPVGVVFLVMQVLEGYFITPRLVGKKVGLSPVGVIIALLVGGAAFGLLGLVLAVPASAALGVLGKDLLALYQKTPFFTGEAAPPEMRVSSQR